MKTNTAGTMRAAVFKAKGLPLVVEDTPIPKPGPGQVLVKVKACGICGSDIHAVNADWTPTDIIMGHEFSGVVAAVGEDVASRHEGDRVLPLPQVSCGRCTACLSGNTFECSLWEPIDYNPKYNGGYAEYVVVGKLDAIALPENIDFVTASSLQPMAVGLNAVNRAGLSADDQVLITGGGPIGLGIAQWASSMAIAHVVVSEMFENRRQVALKMGATAVIDPIQDKDLSAAFKKITGTQPTVIFEAVGIPGMIQQCVEIAAPKSKIVVVGMCQETDHFEPVQCILKQLELIFPYFFRIDEYRHTLEMMNQGRIDPSPMITSTIDLDALPAMIEAMQKPGDQIKVIVTHEKY
jgi:(R,R)-butanediol dehydrogenase/meso-butanediol dehydrogenase/diacetyl reductase